MFYLLKGAFLHIGDILRLIEANIVKMIMLF